MLVTLTNSDPFYSTRVVALGDSITKDTTSTNVNGYRGGVSTELPDLAWLGSVSSGGSACEAWPGERLDELAARLLGIFTSIPQIGIMVVMGGTNDGAQGASGATAIARYTDLLDKISGLSPNTRTIVLSTPNTSDGMGTGQACFDAINSALPALCATAPRRSFYDFRSLLVEADYADTYHFVQSAYTKISPGIAAAIAALA